MSRRSALAAGAIWILGLVAVSLYPGFKMRVATAGVPHHLLHIAGFAVACLLLARAFPRRGPGAVFFLGALALGIEVLQWRLYNSGYTVEWLDLLSDTVGILLGLVFHRMLPAEQTEAAPTGRVHWVHHSPSPYQAALYRSLTHIPGVDFQVHHVLPSVSDRPWQSSFTSGYKERSFQPLLGVDWTLLRLMLKEKDSYFVLACWGEPTNQIAMVMGALLGRRYAMWNDTPNFGRKRNAAKAWLRALFLRGAFRGAHSVMGTGKPALQVMEQMGCAPAKLVNFPCFVDPGDFAPRTHWYRAGERMVFVSSGRLVEDKGYSLSLEALARVFGKGSNDFRYQILGTGPHTETLRAQARKLGIAEQVDFLGWVEPDEAKRVFEAGHVFLHPSHFEPFGVVIAEAMAASMVVIASNDTAAAVDRIENGVNGFLHETGMTGQVCQAIQLLRDRPEEMQRLGMAARRTAEEWPLSRAREIFTGMTGRGQTR